MLTNLKPHIEKHIQPLVMPLAKVHPNVITLIGIVPSLLFFICIVNHLYLLALIAYLGNSLDFLDGMVAKQFHKVSTFGAFLDSTLDRIADFFLIASFGFGHIVRWEICIVLIVSSFMVSYARTRAEQASNNTVKVAIGIIERTERLGVIFLSLIVYMLVPEFRVGTFNVLEISFLLLSILSVVTFLQRVQFAYKNLV